MEEMRLFNANGKPTTWGGVKPKSIRPIVACTKTLVNECPDTEQGTAFIMPFNMINENGC